MENICYNNSLHTSATCCCCYWSMLLWPMCLREHSLAERSSVLFLLKYVNSCGVPRSKNLYFFKQLYWGARITITSSPGLKKLCFRNLLISIPQGGWFAPTLPVPFTAEALFTEVRPEPLYRREGTSSIVRVLKKCIYRYTFLRICS